MSSSQLFPIFSQGTGYGIIVGLGEYPMPEQAQMTLNGWFILRRRVCASHDFDDVLAQKILC